MENASDVVPTHLDQEVDATVVDPTMATVPDSFSESDTESLNSRPLDEHEVEPEPVGLRMTPELRDALISFDVVDLQSVFRRRACVMKSCPKFLVGHYRAAMRFAMTEAEMAANSGDELRCTRALEVVLVNSVAPKDAPPQTTFRGGLLPKSQNVRPFLHLQRVVSGSICSS